MKDKIVKASYILCLLLSPSFAAAQQSSEAPLTNTAIIKLVRAGFKDKTVIAIIRSRPTKFDLNPDRLVELKRSGVSENVILAMLAHSEFVFFQPDDLDDESFFQRGSIDPKTGETNIFGSGGSSAGQTRSRGTRGSNEGETITSGSATVRILRPPSEDGNSSLKLEKTPSLNNQSIVKLIEAGFSEGTIIKRIQDSPANFDLAPERLEELRGRRVSEAILSAMRSAMNEGSSLEMP